MRIRPDNRLDYLRLFGGELQFFAESAATRELANFARSVIREHFGPTPLSLSLKDFREALLAARSILGNQTTHSWARKILTDLEAGQDIYLDKIRLRAVTPGLEKIGAAEAVFFAHRDTWYGNPKCQINAWIPLGSVTANNSFRFYPGYFHKSIANDSENFVAEKFRSQGGFGRVDDKNSSVYPRALTVPHAPYFDIEMKADQLLAFSAAHLHRTLPNKTSETRFSLDFRFFRNFDLAQKLGAPDPDNRSSGLLLEDYALCDC